MSSATKKQEYLIKFIGRLPNVTNCYRNDYISYFERVVVNTYKPKKFKRMVLKHTFILNRMGDEYIVITVYLLNSIKNRYFIIDTDGTIEPAPEYFLKSFDDHLKIFPRKMF
jgi:hypothetical protein